MNGNGGDGVPKIYVLDTSAIIDYPECIVKLADGGNYVIVPQTVTEELDNLQKKEGEARYPARDAAHKLKDLKDEGLINHGLEKVLKHEKDAKKLENGGAVFWENHYQPIDGAVFEVSKNDNVILSCARYVNNIAQSTAFKTVFVTEDINLHLKADSLSEFPVEELRVGKAKLRNPDEVYEGVLDLVVTSKTIDSFLSSGEFMKRNVKVADVSALRDKDLFCNQGVFLVDKSNKGRIVPTRFNEATGTLQDLARGVYFDSKSKLYKPKPILGITPADTDFRQALFLDYALDPDIKMLFAYGQAGTGKTSCAAAGAIKCWTEYNGTTNPVMRGRFESGVFIMRPEYSSSNTEIAAVPGGIALKTRHWVEVLLDKLKEQAAAIEDGSKKFDVEKRVTIGNSGLLRGKDLKNQYILFDEFQNAGRQLNEVALSRVHDLSKCIMTGDIHQIDNHYLTWKNCAITLNVEYLKGKHPSIAVVKLTHPYRNPLMELISQIKDYRI